MVNVEFIDLTTVERWLDALYIGSPDATLRREDRRKAQEVFEMLREVEAMVRRTSTRQALSLVDAAAGKSYVGLLAAKLVMERLRCNASVVTIEADPRRVELARDAAVRLRSSVPIECRAGDASDDSIWPAEPSIVVALHACGPAADTIIDRAVGNRAGSLLLVPCCTGRTVAAAARAESRASQLGVPHHAPVRRRFIQAAVDAERTLRLEAAGYETEVVEFVAPTVTPHNLLWRARRVLEPRRMAAAAKLLEAWTADSDPS